MSTSTLSLVFQSPTNRVNTSKESFLPRANAPSAQPQFQSPTNRVNTSNPPRTHSPVQDRKRFQSPTNRVNTSIVPAAQPPMSARPSFQSPTNRVNTSNLGSEQHQDRQILRVSIPYKSGQHFKSDRSPRDSRLRGDVSIPYKSGQHFKCYSSCAAAGS